MERKCRVANSERDGPLLAAIFKRQVEKRRRIRLVASPRGWLCSGSDHGARYQPRMDDQDPDAAAE